MKKITLLIVFLSIASFSQEKNKRFAGKINTSETRILPVEELNPFVGENQYIIAYEVGDFNGDRQSDAVLVIGNIDEVEIFEKEQIKSKRNLLILKRNYDGVLEKVKENNDVVYCYSCDSNYENLSTRIKFNGNKLAIEHEAGKANRWARIITFEYNREMQIWWLVKEATSVYNIMSSGNLKSEVKTQDDFGFIYFEYYDAFSEDLTKQSKH